MFLKAYKILQLLSIDVVIGACATSFLVAQVLGITLPSIIYFSLGTSVWLTYTIDHLLDAKANTKQVVTPRHKFHLTYFKPLIYAWLGVFVVTAGLSICFLPFKTIYIGLIASALVVLHLVLVKLLGNKISIYIQKELGIAFTYLVGILVGPISCMEILPIYFYLVVPQVFLLAFINLIEFSYFELEEDTRQGQTSIVHSMGKRNIKRLLAVLLAILLVLNIASYVLFPLFLVIQVVLSSMMAVLFTIVYKQRYFEIEERYRLWGDVVFMFPIVLLLF